MKSFRSFPTPMAIVAGVVLAFGATSKADDVPALTKGDGPFMVLAYLFRGPDAENSANALAKELRKDHDLPSFVFRGPDKGGFGDACVLVGNCKTTREAFELRNRVRKIEAKCLANPQDVGFRKGKGLSRAMTTTNPLVKSEDLFPRR